MRTNTLKKGDYRLVKRFAWRPIRLPIANEIHARYGIESRIGTTYETRHLEWVIICQKSYSEKWKDLCFADWMVGDNE